MPGPPPKPTELHRRQGTHRPDRHPATPLVIGGRGKPKAPAGMPADVRREWRWIVDALHEAGILDGADVGMVRAAATALARAEAAAREVRELGLFVMVERAAGAGEVIERREENPARKTEREAWEEFRRCADMLGLAPSSRARLAGLGVTGQSPAQALPGLGELRAIQGGAG